MTVARDPDQDHSSADARHSERRLEAIILTGHLERDVDRIEALDDARLAVAAHDRSLAAPG
jgi:hypothetical protein